MQLHKNKNAPSKNVLPHGVRGRGVHRSTTVIVHSAAWWKYNWSEVRTLKFSRIMSQCFRQWVNKAPLCITLRIKTWVVAYLKFIIIFLRIFFFKFKLYFVQLFIADATIFSKKNIYIFAHKKSKKPPPKILNSFFFLLFSLMAT